jgi:hypothetical protein
MTIIIISLNLKIIILNIIFLDIFFIITVIIYLMVLMYNLFLEAKRQIPK